MSNKRQEFTHHDEPLLRQTQARMEEEEAR
jgi:hypothetical protein